MNDKKVRVRFAPSPTGYMHIGNFRTALFTYLFAKKNGGDFILRIEDTDQKRFVPDALEKLINILNWAGFKYDEGVYLEKGKIVQKVDFGPYIQSERLEIYQKYAQELLDKNQAYYCFCAPERLEKMREEQLKNKQAPMYDRNCLKLSKKGIAQKIKNGEPYVIRQKINTEGFAEFDDLIRGKVKIKNDLLDDQVLLKSDGYPTYNFANVIDDHLMEITHVMRGEEYISSTPKYTQLYQNFGWIEPKIAHLPLILNPDKSKLSKRQGDVAVEDYIQKGYLKEAIINFVALLGWNPGEGETQEIFSIDELIEKFDLSHVHKAGAVFDTKKLDWISSEWIKNISTTSTDQLYQLSASPSFSPSLSPSISPSPSFWEEKEFYNNAPEEKKSEEYLKKVLTIERDRLNNLSQVGESNQFFFKDIKYDKELLRWKKMTDEDLKKSLEKSQEVLEKISETDWTKENLEKQLLEAADKPARNATHSVAGGRGDSLWPLRAALTGAQKSPSPFECAWVLGKKASLERIGQALSLIQE